MSKYNVECALVSALVMDNGFSAGVATLVAEQLSTYLGRMEAKSIAARKDGRTAAFGKVDKDANADMKFLAMKVAKADTSYLPCRLLVIADAATAFAKAAGIPREDISFALPESARGLLTGMEAAGKERQAAADKARAEKEAAEQAIAERQELAARLLAEHDAQEEQRKAKNAKAEKATA